MSKVLESSQVVDRTGAVGKLRSVYCRDPDGNLIELVANSNCLNYGEWMC